MIIRVAGAAALLVGVAAGQPASPRPPANPRVDAIFSRFDKSDSPGCALAVVDHGRIQYERGYGRASLELGAPITPQTVFDIGSTSKQFAAFAILLLEHEGRLSLEDDVRKYVPELPDLGSRVTIRHLLTHTSGLRDYSVLMRLDGHAMPDYTTARDALEILSRQRAANFTPGDEWLYSNTGYFLTSVIVQRVTGETLTDFGRTRIFEPLGMTRTTYLDSTRVVPYRATAYAPRAGGGFNLDMSAWLQIGDGSIQTTVEDLAKWDANFYQPKVGTRQMINAMTTTGALNSGKPHQYGLGLRVDTYRGLKRIWHGGSWAGYRAMAMRFPDQRTSFLITCNVANAHTTDLAERLADVWLERAGLGAPAPTPKAPEKRPEPPPLSDTELGAYAADYITPELTSIWTISVADHRLWLRIRKGDGEVLDPIGADRFSLPDETTLVFERDPASRTITSIRVDDPDPRNFRLERMRKLTSGQ